MAHIDVRTDRPIGTVDRRRRARALPQHGHGDAGRGDGLGGVLHDWDQVVIDGLARYVGFRSIHLYTGSTDYWSDVLAPHFAERTLAVTGAFIDRARYQQRVEHEIGVAYDEWNVWFRTSDGQLEEVYNLADALAVGTYLNVFVRQSKIVRMANLAQLVNVIAPIVTNPRGMFRQPAAQRLTISVVNRDPERALATRIQLPGAAATGTMTVHKVNGDKPGAVNSFEQPDNVAVRRAQQEVRGGDIDVTFAPHSFTLLEVALA